METIVFTICEQIKNISILLNSIIPISTTKVLKAMNFEEKTLQLIILIILNVLIKI